MKVYKFPMPHKVEAAKQDYAAAKPKKLLLSEIDLAVLQHRDALDRIMAKMAILKTVAGVHDYGARNAKDELWRLQRDLEYHAARLHHARDLQARRVN